MRIKLFHQIPFYIITGFSFLFSSCEEVIDLNLNQSTPIIVIEANLTNRFESQLIKISLTKAFTDDNTIIPVKNAVVTIKEENGLTYILKESLVFGSYSSVPFKGKVGLNYTVQVSVNGKTYTAQSTMPQPVLLDSITVTELTFFTSKKKYIQVNYQDTPNIGNQYNYVLSVNDEVRNAYYVDSDRFNDGKNVTNTIFNDDPELKKGDKVLVDFQCIEMNIYRYFYSISQISGNGGPPTAPSNPDSNFDNGALGYFSAHTTQKVSVIIP
jgi:hypothetical protein